VSKYLITTELQNKITNPEQYTDLDNKQAKTYDKEPVNLSEITEVVIDENSLPLTEKIVNSFDTKFTGNGLTSLQNYLRSTLYGSGEMMTKILADKYIDSNRCILSEFVKTDAPEGKLQSILYSAPIETKIDKDGDEINDTVTKTINLFSIKYPTSYTNPLMSKNKTIGDIKSLANNKYNSIANALLAVGAYPDYMIISGLENNITGNGIYLKFNPTDINYKMASDSPVQWQLAKYNGQWYITFDPRTSDVKEADTLKETDLLKNAWIPKNAIAKNTTITGTYTKITGSTETSTNIKVSDLESNETIFPSEFDQSGIPATLQIKNVNYQIVIDPKEDTSDDSAFVKNFGIKVVVSFKPIEQKINEETFETIPVATIGIRRPEFNPQTWVDYSTSFNKNIDPLSTTEFNKMFKSKDSKFTFSYNTENIKWLQQTKYLIGADGIPVVGTKRYERVWNYSKQNWETETKLQYPTIMVRLVTVYVTYDGSAPKELLTDFNFTNNEVTSSSISKTTDKNTEFLFKNISTTKPIVNGPSITTNFRFSQMMTDVTTGKPGTYIDSIYPTAKSTIPSDDLLKSNPVYVNTYTKEMFEKQPYNFEESTDGNEACTLSVINFYLNSPKDLEYTSYTELTPEEHTANIESKKYINYFLPIYNSVTINKNQPLTQLVNCDLAFSASIESLTYDDHNLPKKETLDVSMYQSIDDKKQESKQMPSGVVVPAYNLYSDFTATISLTFNKFDHIPSEWLDIDSESYSITWEDVIVNPIYEGVLFTKTPEGVIDSAGKFTTDTNQMLEFYKLISGNKNATIAEFNAYKSEDEDPNGDLVFNYTNEKLSDGSVSKPGVFQSAGDTSKLSMFELVIQSISKEVNRNISSYIINDAIKSNTDSIIKLELYTTNVIVPNINTLITSTNTHEGWINDLFKMIENDRNNMKYTYNYIMNVDQKIGTYKTITDTTTIENTISFVVVSDKFNNNIKEANDVKITLSAEVDTIVRTLTIKSVKTAGTINIIPSAYIPDPNKEKTTIKTYNLFDINGTEILADTDLVSINSGTSITLLYDGNRNWYIVSTSETYSIVKNQQIQINDLTTKVTLLENPIAELNENTISNALK